MEKKREVTPNSVKPDSIEQLRAVALEKLKEELEWIEHNPPDGDPYLSSYAYALGHLLEYEEVTIWWTEALYPTPREYEQHHFPNQTEAFQKIVKSLQKQFLYKELHLERREPVPAILQTTDYPTDFADKEHCLEVLGTLLLGEEYSDSILSQTFVELRGFSLMSNVEERYKSAGLLLAGYWNDTQPRRVLDVGSSIGVGGAMLLRPQDVTWDQFEVVVDIKDASSAGDPLATNLLQDQLASYPTPQQITGVDEMWRTWSQVDPNLWAWIWSCSFYPQELLTTRKERFKQLLETLNDERLSIEGFDFTDPNAPQQIIQKHGYHDEIFISTMEYQLTAGERQLVFENALQCVKPDGLIVVQDFFDRDESGMKLLPRDNWYQGPYYTYVFEAAKPERGWQEVFVWENGRCHRLQLGRDARRIIKQLAN